MNNYKLYLHTAPNNKRYYGITKQDIKRRWRASGYKGNQHFTNAINKYGWDNIKHEILFNGLTEYEAKELEQYMIQWYDTANKDYGYNISLGGEGCNGLKGEKHPMYGKHHTEETKKKISKATIGENNSMYGKPHPEESKNKQMIDKGKKIIAVNIKDGKMFVFDSIRDAHRKGFNRSCISQCLNPEGNQKKHKGYKWYNLTIQQL